MITPVLNSDTLLKVSGEKNLYTLFHLSGGFAIPPKKKYVDFMNRDRTQYFSIVNRSSRLITPRYVDENPTELGLNLSTIRGYRQPKLYERNYYGQLLAARTIYDAMVTHWNIVDRQASANILSFKYISLRASGPLLEFPSDLSSFFVQYKNLFVSRRIAEAIGDLGFGLKPFKENTAAGSHRTSELGTDEDQARSAEMRTLVTNFMAFYIDQILAVRDHIVTLKEESNGLLQQVLFADFPARAELREQIMNLAYGRPLSRTRPGGATELMDGSAFALAAPEAVRPLAQSLTEVLPLFDEPVAKDPLPLIRRAMSALDVTVQAIPASLDFQELARAIQSEPEVSSKISDFMSALTRMSERAEQDDAALESVVELVGQLGEKVFERLSELETQTNDVGEAAKVRRKLEEAQLIRLSLAQTTAALRQRAIRQAEHASVISHLLALLRSVQTQKTLGESTVPSTRDFVEAIHALAGLPLPH